MSPIFHLSKGLTGLSSSATVSMNERSNALAEQGKDIYKFGLGQSPFPVPELVKNSLIAHAGEKDYLPVKGLLSLREAVCQYHQDYFGLEGYQADQVLIGPGSKELLFLIQLAYGAELLLPRGSWVSYAPQAQLIGSPVKYLTSHPQDGWRLSAAVLDEVCHKEPNKPRILILNYPNNPTGMTLSTTQLKDLADVARKHQLIVISDEIYGELHYQGQHQSLALYYPEGTIVTAGLSKWCGAGGWRLGTALFPKQLDWLCDAVETIASETYTSASAPIQYAAVNAFAQRELLDEYLCKSRLILSGLGSWIAETLQTVGMLTGQPEGGFYVMPNATPELQRRLEQRGIHTSKELCEQLLEDTGVATLPGTHFGSQVLSLRLAFVNFDGQQALTAITDPKEELSFSWYTQYCPKTITGITRLAEWLNKTN